MGVCSKCGLARSPCHINYLIHDFSCVSFSCGRLDIFSQLLAMFGMININHHGMIQPLYIITTVTSPT